MPLYGTGYPLLAPDGSASAPSYALAGATTTGLFSSSGQLRISVAGTDTYRFGSSQFQIISSTAALGLNGDTILLRDGAANVMALRNSTNAQTLRGYHSYTDANNYARWALKTAAGSIELAAETSGTGADDNDVILTPTGTGRVRFGTHAAVAAETVTGYIEIKDAGGTVRKVAVVS